MRILTLSCEYPPVGGGGATACQCLAEALVRAGHEVDVVTSCMRGLLPFEEHNGVQIHRVSGIRWQRHHSTAAEQLTQLIPTYRKTMELVQRRDFDLLHCHFVVPGGLLGYLVSQRTGLPYVITAHGSDVPSYNPHRFRLLHRLIRPLWRQIVDGSMAVSAPSEFLKGLIAADSRCTVTVIPNPFDPLPTGKGTAGRRVLVVTRMVRRKGVQHLLEALGDLETHWEFLIVGDGPYLKHLKKAAKVANAKVRFLGFVPRDKLPELYQSARLFVFPSLQENFPMVLLEAMAAGCAVLTTSAPGCAEVVGDAGVLVEPGDSVALRGALARLLADDAAIERLRAASRRRVQRFASVRVADQFSELFRSSGACRPSGSASHGRGRSAARS